MPSWLRVLVLTVLTIATLDGCGGPDEVVAAGKDPAATSSPAPLVRNGGSSSPTVQPADPPRLGAPSENPSFNPDPYAALAVNNNRINSRIGATCWLRWEIARSVLIAQLGTPTELFTKAVDSSTDLRELTSKSLASRMAAALASPAKSILAGPERVEDQLGQFAVALVSAAESLARGDAPTARSVNFEAMPGFQAYGQIAPTSSDCVTP